MKKRKILLYKLSVIGEKKRKIREGG